MLVHQAAFAATASRVVAFEAIGSAAIAFLEDVIRAFPFNLFPQAHRDLDLLRSCIDRLAGERTMSARWADAVRNCRAGKQGWADV